MSDELTPPMEWKEGLFEDIPFEQYAAVDALNGSRLMPMRRSPMAYKHALDNPGDPTDPMKLGTYIHRMILEPSLMGEFAVWGTLPEEKVRQGKVWESFKELNRGATIITKNERDAMVSASAAVRKNPLAAKYLRMDGPTEVSMFWTDSSTGRRMKGRIDKLIPDKHLMINLKSCRSSEQHKFGAQAFTLGYHIHEALYWDGYKTLTGKDAKQKFIAFESKAPHEGAVYRVTPDIRVQGLDDLGNLLSKLAACEKSGKWPPDMLEESDLLLPVWAYTTPEDLADTEVEMEEVWEK